MLERKSADDAPQVKRPGRRRSTNAVELEKAAFDLFERKGFESTTVDDIAAAVGINRRTFFRYFESKNDVVWGNFSEQLQVMRDRFAQCPPDQTVMDAVRTVVVDFNRFDRAEVPWHRKRMELILQVPTLQAHSTLRYREWRAVVAEFVGSRLGVPSAEFLPQSIAYAALGMALASYEHWLAAPEGDLPEILDRAFLNLAAGFSL